MHINIVGCAKTNIHVISISQRARSLLLMQRSMITVEPLIKDPPRKVQLHAFWSELTSTLWTFEFSLERGPKGSTCTVCIPNLGHVSKLLQQIVYGKKKIERYTQYRDNKTTTDNVPKIRGIKFLANIVRFIIVAVSLAEPSLWCPASTPDLSAKYGSFQASYWTG